MFPFKLLLILIFFIIFSLIDVICISIRIVIIITKKSWDDSESSAYDTIDKTLKFTTKIK